MKAKHLLAVSASVLCATIVAGDRVYASPPQYIVTDLGSGYGAPYAINDSGQITGNLNLGSVQHAMRWTGTVAEDLGTLGGTNSFGQAINAPGQVAGFYFLTTSTSPAHAVRWTGDYGATTAQDLGTLGGTNSFGTAINSFGHVAGYAEFTVGNNNEHAVVWNETTPIDLGTLGGDRSEALGINDSGQVAGWSSLLTGATFPAHALRWTGTLAEDLGTIGGTSSFAYGINASGQVAGYSNPTGSSAYHAVRWTGTTAEDLGTLGGSQSMGYDINDSGDVIGMSWVTNRSSSNTAFIYTSGTMYKLLDLLLPGSGVTRLAVNEGNSLNNLGEIVAYGNIGGAEHAFLLTPTPEPASAVLLLGGAALLGLRRRR